MKKMTALALTLAVLVASAAGLWIEGSSVVGAEKKPSDTASKKPSKQAVQRSRKQVEMLDNIYKQAIVLITDKYVNSEDDFPAGSAAVTLFANVSKGGSHQVRLIDASGEPYDSKNVAQDDFERDGIKQLKAGRKVHEQIVLDDKGKYQLRVLTPVPVVMKKCVMCHAHYADAKKGEPIGAISYTMPIE